jgi:hypothetical protein
VLSFCGAAPLALAAEPAPWPRHTIDHSSRGADGIRASDVNADGLLDLTTGWEEGGVVRAYLNPGPQRVKFPWPAVSVGQVPAPEDAVFADLDGDGASDVVSSTEGDSRTLFVHWAPAGKQRYQDALAWNTGAIEATKNHQQWMFALPLDVDGRNGIDLVVGGKNAGAQIGWLESPADPRDLSAWRWHPLYEAGWIMSLIARDMDADGDLDVLASDRKGPRRGVLWLENPGHLAVARDSSVERSGPPSAEHDERRLPPGSARWIEHRIGEVNQHEVMFLDAADVDGDGLEDVIAAVREGPLLLHKRLSANPARWQTYEIALPKTAGTGKAVAAADINLDGGIDLVFSCENAGNGRSGVGWLSRNGAVNGNWEFHEISGPEGTKFDRLELLDLDADGDLDVLTCEETENLGVIWYENPAR